MIKVMRPDVGGQQGLVDICNHIQKDCKIERMCEIGSYAGQSTIIFHNNLNDLKELYAIDPYSLEFNTDNLFNSKNIENIYETFLHNTKPYPTIKHKRLDSEEASKTFENDYFDFIYVDGCHKYESVLRDIRCWKDKIKNGGYMGFHDADFDSVMNALSNYFDTTQGYRTADNSITFRIIK
jgi:predicted O-methyltransferase YrrM